MYRYIFIFHICICFLCILYCIEFRTRHKLERWHLTTPANHPSMDARVVVALNPARTARKALHRLHVLRDLVPPRVASACFSAMWNRWTTERRFHNRDSVNNYCQLGCGGRAEDSIEHYAGCPRVQQMGQRFLRLRSEQLNIHTFMMCNPTVTTLQELTTTALLVCATHRGFNQFRRIKPPSEQYVYDALCQWVREGVRGHRVSIRTLGERWSERRRSLPLPNIPLALGQRRQAMNKRSREATSAQSSDQTAAKVGRTIILLTGARPPTSQ